MDKIDTKILEECFHSKNENNSQSTSNKVEEDNNHLYFNSFVDPTSVKEFILSFKKLEKRIQIQSIEWELPIDIIPINIHISSFGGYLLDGFRLSDIIENSKLNVITYAEGYVASAASLFFLSGKQRLITKKSFMMIHQQTASLFGKFQELLEEVENEKKFMETMKKWYLTKTHMESEFLDDLLKKDTWLSSEECLKYGLVDKII